MPKFPSLAQLYRLLRSPDVADGQQRVSALAGAGPLGYRGFTAQAGPTLIDAAACDATLAANLRDAAGFRPRRPPVLGIGDQWCGHRDTAAMAPATLTAAGQRALITALRARVAQQQQLIAAQRLRDARLAAMVRSLGYGRTAAAGGGNADGRHAVWGRRVQRRRWGCIAGIVRVVIVAAVADHGSGRSGCRLCMGRRSSRWRDCVETWPQRRNRFVWDLGTRGFSEIPE